MKILIIEDDKNKVNQVSSYLFEIFESIEITKKYSYQSGLVEVMSETYDILLLDMSMPTFDISESEDGGRYRPFAGIEILNQLERRGIVIPTIVITQFEQFGDIDSQISLVELTEKMESDFVDIYIGTVYYNSSENNWMTKLKELITGV